MAQTSVSNTEIGKYRQVQKLAFQAVQEVERKLYAGISEKQAAAMVDEILSQQGVELFFHRAFAWFGARSGFVGFRKPMVNFDLSTFLASPLPHRGKGFLPTETKLQEGMVVILDVAPCLEGYAADIGYSFVFGSNPAAEKALNDLEFFRSLILEMVHQEKTLQQIYRKVDSTIRDLGYRNCHSIYPQGVLGHRVGKLLLADWPTAYILGFPWQSVLYLADHFLQGTLGAFPSDKPTWNDICNYPIGQGLWAVEPHFGTQDFGVKWEELLVVDETKAYWLEEKPPHVQHWQKSKEYSKNEKG